MNRSEAGALLRRVLTIYGLGRKASDDEITEWAHFLGEVHERAAHDALDRIIDRGERAPRLPDLLAELRTEQAGGRAGLENRPVGTPGCARCDGSGFELVMQDVERAVPCAACRPDHAFNRANHRSAPPLVRVEPQLSDAEYAAIGLRNIVRIRAEIAERAAARARTGRMRPHVDDLGLHHVLDAAVPAQANGDELF